ncbi:MAG: DUF938 domain-containing protein [Pseudomonadota bacterium]
MSNENSYQRGPGGQEIALEARASDEARLSSPSVSRNREAIADVFCGHMPAKGNILEIASGTGEHVVTLAGRLPDVMFHPGDPDPVSRASIAAWTDHVQATNIAPPHAIDVIADRPLTEHHTLFQGLLCINMIHIAPFAATKGLFAYAQSALAPGGSLFLYGPFARNGVHTAPSNADFDASLKSRNADWGVRDLDRQVTPLAHDHGFDRKDIIQMPANNLAVIFQLGSR